MEIDTMSTKTTSLDEEEKDTIAVYSNSNSNSMDSSKESTDRKLKNNYDHGNQIVQLNARGVKYITRISTLTNFSNKHPHFLSAMFSGKYLLKPDINDNEYFIDRNGDYFKYILDILTYGPQVFVQRILPKLAAETIVYIEEETKFFGLYDLVFSPSNPNSKHFNLTQVLYGNLNCMLVPCEVWSTKQPCSIITILKCEISTP